MLCGAASNEYLDHMFARKFKKNINALWLENVYYMGRCTCIYLFGILMYRRQMVAPTLEALSMRHVFGRITSLKGKMCMHTNLKLFPLH